MGYMKPLYCLYVPCLYNFFNSLYRLSSALMLLLNSLFLFSFPLGILLFI
nr:MAG TPA: hypothetical protein [Caudoviricetes sp.]